MALGFVRGFDGHVEVAGEFLVRGSSASLDDCSPDTVRRSGQLRAQVGVSLTRESARQFVERDRQRVRPLPCPNVFEILHSQT